MKCGKLVACVLVGLLGLGFATSCGHNETKEEGTTFANVPADSPLAKITKGMSQHEVVDALGQPTETQTAPGRGNWIPFNYGGASTVLTILHYKGQGRIYLENRSSAGANVVVKVIYDANEPGYAR